MKQFFFFLATLFIGLSSSFSQEEENKLSLTNSTVNEKFDYVITKSNSYQEFKVIKKTWLHTLKKQVLDSVVKQKSEISTLSKTIESQKSNIVTLEAKIVELNNTITQISTDKENITFLGTDLKKGLTEASGDPPKYLDTNETISIISDSARNIEQGISVFEYFDSQGVEITDYNNISDVAFVKVNLVVNINENRLPDEFTLRSSATLRNLKTNL